MSKEYDICKEDFNKRISRIRQTIKINKNEIQEEIKHEENSECQESSNQKKTDGRRKMDS